ncbi:hypothetical protein HPC49_22095 [Pyxidicoccus fallax]|uniref:Uncharacterized protein n=1 Tax=Pyxidicoccus fallax TaxID=394095 RepID=A0A848LCA5_9BACT|nr:lamin tail domain-containing protein [Pyxidicoccus fallax]NMO16307.1 hypothetical protein [Pyxidicoccus fallax]NPC80904.1 hypothetical protein [Pyxidicoccus fallax]
MSRRPLSLARLLGLSVLCLGLSLACGGESTPQPPSPLKPLPDASRSTVEVSRASGVLADGEERVDILVTVKQADGSAMQGRTVRVEVSGEGNTVTQPAGVTDAQGRATASVVSTREGTKRVTASVDAEGGAVVLASRPDIAFTAPVATRLFFAATALTATAGAPIGGLEVSLRDTRGRTVTSATDEVTLSLATGPGDAVLEGTLKARAVDGVVRFPEVVLKKAGTGYQLKVEAPGLEGATSPVFTVAPALAASLELSGLPTVLTAGAAGSAQVTVRDAFGNVATNYTGTLAVTSTDATADLPASHVFTAADAGRFTFSGITLKRAGTHQVTVRDGASAALTAGQEVGVLAGEAAGLAFLQAPPARVSVRATLAPVTVELRDAFGNRTAVGTPLVTMRLVRGQGLEGVTSAAPVDGVATFTNLRLSVEGPFQLVASAQGLADATSAAIDIVDDVAPAVPSLRAGASTSDSATVTWTAVGDDGGEGRAQSQVLRISDSPITSDAEFDAASEGPALGRPAEPGVAESATLTGLRPRRTYHVALRVTDDHGNSARSASVMVQTQDAGVTQLAFSVPPVSGTAGALLPAVHVELRDENGDVVPTATAPVTLGLVDHPEFEPVQVAAVNGVARFDTLRVNVAGRYQFVASIGGLSVTSDFITIQADAASRLALTGLVGPVTAGVAGSLTVTAYDRFGNVATGYRGTVRFSSDDLQADLPDDFTFLETDEGQRSFEDVVLRTAGPRRVEVVDVANALLTDDLQVEVASDTADHLELTGLPEDVTAGVSQRLTVSARDRHGNLVTGYSGTVRFTSTDPLAQLPADFTFSEANAGQHEFPVELRTAGSRSITVEERGTGRRVTASTRVAAADATRMTLVLSNTTPSAGQAVNATVAVLDPFNNVATGYRGTVGLHVPGDAQAVIAPESHAFTEEDAGQYTFSVTLAAVGDRAVEARETAGTLPRIEAPVTVGPGLLSALGVARVPGPVVAGQGNLFVVTARDRFGNVKTDYTGSVVTTTTDPNPGELESHVYTEADQGEFTFRVYLQTAGAQRVTFTDAAAGVSGSEDVTVDSAPPTRLVFATAPASGEVRQPLAQTRVELRDAFGNTARVSMPEVTLSLSGGPAGTTLGGTRRVAPVDGVATFSNLTVDQEGDFVLLAATDDPGITSVDTRLTIEDHQPPAPAPAFAASLVDNRTVRLSWRATGDDHDEGRAARYELRFSTEPLTADNFGSATEAPTGQPQAPGADESATIEFPPAQATWYFGLRVIDSVGNASTLVTASIEVPGPCGGVVCAPRPAECSSTRLSLITYTGACVVRAGEPRCEYTSTEEVCPGVEAVCFQGACTTASAPMMNELAISEVMHSPSFGTTEYIELTSTTGRLLNVANLLISYDNGAGRQEGFMVNSSGLPVLVPGGGTFVMAENADVATNGGVPADYSYAGGSFAMDNTGRLTVQAGTTVVDELVYTTAFPRSPGRAMNLVPMMLGASEARELSWYWCDASEFLPGGDRGTPGLPNETCLMEVHPPVDFCNIQPPVDFPAPILVNTPQTVSSRFFDGDVTTRNPYGNDHFPFVVAEVGFGSNASAPETWRWEPATLNASYSVPGGSNDDEMLGTLRITAPGAYYYGFRYRFTGGTGNLDWVYCDRDGVVGPNNPAQFGTVTVNAPPPPPVADHVVISEVSGAASGSGSPSTDQDFVELHNPTDAPVNIGGWKLQYRTASTTSSTVNYTVVVTIPNNTSIPAHGYYLIASPAYTNSSPAVAADLTWTTTVAVNLSNSAGNLRLGMAAMTDSPSNTTGVVDTLAYGSGRVVPEGSAAPAPPANGGSIERKALPSSTQASMAPGGTDAGRGNGSDTDNNSVDFVPRTARQPQNRASGTEQP